MSHILQRCIRETLMPKLFHHYLESLGIVCHTDRCRDDELVAVTLESGWALSIKRDDQLVLCNEKGNAIFVAMIMKKPSGTDYTWLEIVD